MLMTNTRGPPGPQSYASSSPSLCTKGAIKSGLLFLSLCSSPSRGSTERTVLVDSWNRALEDGRFHFMPQTERGVINRNGHLLQWVPSFLSPMIPWLPESSDVGRDRLRFLS